jgi:hypothetical protein
LYTDISTEGEAAIGLLLCSANDVQKPLSQGQIENISRILVMCSRFRNQDMNTAFKKVFVIQQESPKNEFILYCAALIKEDLADTLFTMCCETALIEGDWSDAYAETLATIGIALQLPEDDIKSIIRTYLIRNRWNIKVEG